MTRVLYYNVYITIDGEKTNIPFSDVLDNVAILDDRFVYKLVDNKGYALIRSRPPQELMDIQNRAVCFAHYRDKKPFLGRRWSGRLDEIDDDVIEPTTCFYQHNSRLLMVEYSHFGAKAKHITSYLTRFLPLNDQINWGIDLEPIESQISIRDVLNSNDIKFIEFNLDLSENARNANLFVDNNFDEEANSILGQLLRITSRVHSELGGNSGKITLSNGRPKDGHMNNEQLKQIIRVLDVGSNFYKSITVNYSSNELGKYHNLNLKHAGILEEVIEPEGDSWEIISREMEQNFYNRGRTGDNGHARFRNTLLAAELPEIRREIQRVNDEAI